MAQVAEGTAPDSRATFVINSTVLNKLLIALNECSEWGRVALLGCLARYKAADDKESEHICERVMPQFQHANGAVVLTAVRVSVALSNEESSPSSTSYVQNR